MIDNSKKEKVYSWIWWEDNFKDETPIVRLMKEKDKPKRIWTGFVRGK